MADRNENNVKGTGTGVVETNSRAEDVIVEPRHVLYEWTSDQRAFRRLKKRQYLIVLASVVILMVALAILGQYWFMAALGALMFLLYAVGTVPPAQVTHVITNHGIETNNVKYEWDKLESYWFGKRDDQKYLNVETSIPFPGRLIMLVDDEQLMKVHEMLKTRLKYVDMRGQSRFSAFLEGDWINMVEGEESGGNEEGGGNGKVGEGKGSAGK
jgi:hypothetical protein